MKNGILGIILAAHKLWLAGAPRGVRADLRWANLQGANLQVAYLQEAKLQEANLRGVDLQEADLRRADLRRADLQGANLQEANLRGADLRRANLQGANLQYANLRRADLQGAKLQEANLQGANLQYANLRRADLQGAKLQEANLQGARLRGARLQGGYKCLAVSGYQLVRTPAGYIAGCRGPFTREQALAHWARSDERERWCLLKRFWRMTMMRELKISDHIYARAGGGRDRPSRGYIIQLGWGWVDIRRADCSVLRVRRVDIIPLCMPGHSQDHAGGV